MTAQRSPLALVPVLMAGVLWPGPHKPLLAVAVLAALLAVLLAAGRLLSRRLLPDADGGTRWTATAVFAAALATLPATLLGHLGLLTPDLFLLWVAALATLAWAASRLPSPATEPAPEPEPPPQPVRAEPLDRAERVVAIAAVTIIVVSLFAHLRTVSYAPPGFYGFDDNSYHLSTVATWLETDDLSMIRFDYGDPSTPFYPIVGELAAWVLLAPFGDNDVAARWTQLPFALATLAAMAALARRLGLRLRHALPALVLFGALYRVFPLLALGAGNDHATSFFTLASVSGLLEVARRRTVGAALYAGTALGLLVGTKYLGVLFLGPVLAVGALAWLAARRSEPGSADRALRVALALVAAAGLAGGYTYLRNAVTVGNPLFPLPVTVAGHPLLPGWQAAPVAWLHHRPEAAIAMPGFLVRADLWGTAPPWLLVTAAIVAPLVCLAGLGRRLDPRRAGRIRDAAILLLPVAIFLVFRFLVHDHRDIRYLLPGIALAAVAWTWLAARADTRFPGAGPALRVVAYGAALASLFEWQHLPPAAAAVRLALGLGLGAAAVWGSHARPALAARFEGALRRPAVRRTLAVLVVVIACGWATHVAARYPDRKLELAPLPRWLEQDAEARGIGVDPAGPRATVAYVGFNSPYLYWGSRLRHRVVIVPTRRGLGPRLYDWGRPPAGPGFRTGTYTAWSENLARLGVDYVVVVREGGAEPERRWMKRHPRRFEKAAEIERTEIWRVLAPGVVPSRPERSRR